MLTPEGVVTNDFEKVWRIGSLYTRILLSDGFTDFVYDDKRMESLWMVDRNVRDEVLRAISTS